MGLEGGASLNARLEKLVIESIAPRLALLHRDWTSDRPAVSPSRDDVETFTQAILAADSGVAERLFQRLREKSYGVDELFETLLAPAARRFGELWAEDACDFVDVTVGVNRLRVMLEKYAGAPVGVGDSHRRALLIATPQERHLFGLDVVASFLRASGWDVVLAVGVDAEEVGRLAREGWFAVAGVTVSRASLLDEAARALAAVRRASVNGGISLLAGGSALVGQPELVARIGADALAENGPSAALLAQKLYLRQVEAPETRAAAPSQSRIQLSNASN